MSSNNLFTQTAILQLPNQCDLIKPNSYSLSTINISTWSENNARYDAHCNSNILNMDVFNEQVPKGKQL